MGYAKMPLGRKPKAVTKAWAQAQVDNIQNAKDALAFLVEVMKDVNAPRDLRIKCALGVMDRVVGRPTEIVESTVGVVAAGEEATEAEIAEMTDEELNDIIRQAEAISGEGKTTAQYSQEQINKIRTIH